MARRTRFTTSGLLIAVVLVTAAYQVGQAQASQEDSFLLIETFSIGPHQVVGDAIEEMTGMVQSMRQTGEYRSVRLYIHDYGPELALYILAEPNSWQAIRTGGQKLFAARPDLLSQPFEFAGHTDNILSEIPVP